MRVLLEAGVPLCAMLAYFSAEVAKNSYLVRHPVQWIETSPCHNSVTGALTSSRNTFRIAARSNDNS
jgi:hypothetical protein